MTSFENGPTKHKPGFVMQLYEHAHITVPIA